MWGCGRRAFSDGQCMYGAACGAKAPSSPVAARPAPLPDPWWDRLYAWLWLRWARLRAWW
jgi:hypothetical protein